MSEYVVVSGRGRNIRVIQSGPPGPPGPPGPVDQRVSTILGDVGEGHVLHNASDRELETADHWPDGNFGFFLDGSDQIVIGADGSGSAEALYSSDDLSVRSSVVIANLEVGVAYAGGGPVFEHGGSTYMIYHGEEWSDESATNFWSFLGLAKLIGSVWTHVCRIVEPNATKEERFLLEDNLDICGGPFTFHTEGGLDYIYVWHKDCLSGDQNPLTLCVTRCLLTEIETPASWYKWNGADWSEPGLGGQPYDIIPEPMPGYTGWFDVVKVADELYFIATNNSEDLWTVKHCTTSLDDVLTGWSGWVTDILETETSLFYVNIISDERFTNPDETSLTDSKIVTLESVAGGAGTRWADAEVIRRDWYPLGKDGLKQRVEIIENKINNGSIPTPRGAWVEVPNVLLNSDLTNIGVPLLRYRVYQGQCRVILPSLLHESPPTDPTPGSPENETVIFQLPEEAYAEIGLFEPHAVLLADYSLNTVISTISFNADGTIKVYGLSTATPIVVNNSYTYDCVI